MAYATYTDVQNALFVTFAASGEPPPIQSQVTAIIAQVEGLAAAYIHPRTLAQANTNNSAALTSLIVDWVIKKLMLADKWNRARGSSSSLEGVNFTSADFLPDREFLRAFKALAEDASNIIDVVKMVKD